MDFLQVIRGDSVLWRSPRLSFNQAVRVTDEYKMANFHWTVRHWIAELYQSSDTDENLDLLAARRDQARRFNSPATAFCTQKPSCALLNRSHSHFFHPLPLPQRPFHCYVGFTVCRVSPIHRELDFNGFHLPSGEADQFPL